MAKVMFVSRASSSKQFTYSSIFDMLETIKVFLQYKNQRGASTCYMILGYNLATQLQDLNKVDQNEDFYIKSIKYMKRAELLQKSLLEEYQTENLDAKSGQFKGSSELREIIIENQFILCFRMYTRAIISSQKFLAYDESFRLKYHNEQNGHKMYLQSLVEYDRIGLDAIEHFEKCLETLPKIEGRNNHRRGKTIKGNYKEPDEFNDLQGMTS